MQRISGVFAPANRRVLHIWAIDACIDYAAVAPSYRTHLLIEWTYANF